MSSLLLLLSYTTGLEAGVDSNGLLNDETILDELAHILPYIMLANLLTTII